MVRPLEEIIEKTEQDLKRDGSEVKCTVDETHVHIETEDGCSVNIPVGAFSQDGKTDRAGNFIDMASVVIGRIRAQRVNK